MENDVNLEARVSALETWQKQRQSQQIAFPLDINSQNILSQFFVESIGILKFVNVSGGNFNMLLLKQNGVVAAVSSLASLVQFTANPTTDFITVGADIANNTQGSYTNGEQVILYSTGDLPTPLTSTSPYFVVSATAGGTQIKLSTTSGGSPVNIIDAGIGMQYMFLVQ